MLIRFQEQDYQLFKQKGIKLEEIIHQIGIFQKGLPPIKLVEPATINNGAIKVLSESQVEHYIHYYENLRSNKLIYKFTPASGAATRMFKKLYQFLNSDDLEPKDEELQLFFAHIEKFAFFDDLNTACQQLYNANIKQLIQNKQYKEVIRALLDDKGLGYGHLPKALIKFHRYGQETRTAMEEHLVEGKTYAIGKDNQLIMHFTASPEHLERFNQMAEQLVSKYQNPQVQIKFEFSVQDPSTDTIAVDMINIPFRKKDGTLLFRPGGHGALIYNLNRIEADLIFIKNIDNVAPDRLKPDTEKYFKALAGYLLTLKSKIDAYLELLDIGASSQDLDDIYTFIQETLQIKPKVRLDSNQARVDFARKILNRPLRVAGMVKNLNQEGGGPFLVEYDEFISPQIVEKSQIDLSDERNEQLLKQSTHFNPTFMVLSVKDYKGKKFNLLDYVDQQASFITIKTYEGQPIKALERPGLWNGAMAFWNTVFVEVPLTVFNPVKTVFDLLKPNHQ